MDGILLINKEKDYTSHDVVAITKKLLHEKVGHTGTLDPNATGVLPLLIGKGTKLSKYLMDHNKKYQAVLRLGVKTDTADGTGKIVQEQEVGTFCLEEKTIKGIFITCIGKQEQYPPMYSAIKVKGKKLYEYAREGKIIQVPPRAIEIYHIQLDKIDELKKEITFTVACSKGTYIRTLCETIAEKLGTIGCMQELVRTQVGGFLIQNCITIRELEAEIQGGLLEKHFLTMEELLKDKERIVLAKDKLELFLHGVKLSFSMEDQIVRIYTVEDQFIGTGEIKKGTLKRDVILD